MTLSDWRAVTEPLGRRRTFSAPQGSAAVSTRECAFSCVPVRSRVFLCVPACSCVRAAAFFCTSDCVQMCLRVGGHLCTDYPVHLEDSGSGWASLDGRASCKARIK